MNADVRVEALQSLTVNVKMRSLTIQQRVHLVQSGLTDRDASVRKACVELCLEWLKSQGSSIPTLLKAFDVENTDDKVVELLLEALLANVNLDRVEWRNVTMTPELAALWRAFVQWHHKKKSESVVEANMPESLIEYCELITTISTELVSGYTLRQVLLLAPLLDKGDEGGRRAVCGLLAEVAAQDFVSEVDVEAIVRALFVFSFGMADFSERMIEAVKRARVSLELFEQEENDESIERQEDRISELKRLLGPSHLHFIAHISNGEEEEQDNDEKDADSADNDVDAWKEELKLLIRHRNNRQNVSEWSWVRTFTIIQHLYSYTYATDLDESRSAVAEGLLALVPRYLAVGMSHDSTLVRVAAIKAVGALAVCDVRRNVVSNIELLYHALSNDELEVRVEALKVLFDMVFLAGFEIFTATPDQAFVPNSTDYAEPSCPHEYPEHSIFSVLFQYLRSEDELLQTTAVEGFTKLMASKKLVDALTLSELLVLLFDPGTNENATLQQSLSLFMPMYAFASYKNQELFAASFKSALHRVVQADSESTLAEAHVPTFLKFLLHLVDADKLREMHGNQDIRPEGAKSLQNALGLDVANQILLAPGSRATKPLAKFFDYFTIDCADVQTIRQLEHAVKRCAESIKTDKVALKAMDALAKSLAETIPATIPTLSEEEVDDLEGDVRVSTKKAAAALRVAKSTAPQKKAPPKSSKKLVSSKARRTVHFDDSSEDELDVSDDEAVFEKPVKSTAAKRVGRTLMEDFEDVERVPNASAASPEPSDSESDTVDIDEEDEEFEAPVVKRSTSKAAVPKSTSSTKRSTSTTSTAYSKEVENDKTRANAKAKVAAAAPSKPAKITKSVKKSTSATAKTTARAAKLTEKA